jgi:DNA gyrase inhibitor GyrI
MSELEVRVVELKPMQVASVLGYGTEPELQAWGTLLQWASEQGLLQDPGACRFFGFNNPDPTPGSPNYGYEQWLEIPSHLQTSGDVKRKQFPGGTFGVTGCNLVDIGEKWQQLVAWREASDYYLSDGICLEALINPADFITPAGEMLLEQSRFAEFRLDLYLPIVE